MRDEHSAAAAGLSDGRTTRRKLARSRQLAETLRRELAAAGGAPSAREARLAWMPSYHYWSHLG